MRTPGGEAPSRIPWRSIGIVMVAAVFVTPLFLLVAGSLRPPGVVPPDGFQILPANPTTDAYELVGRLLPRWPDAFVHSSLVALLAVPLTIAVSSAAGLAMVLGPRRVRLLVGATVLAALVVPAGALWVPRFVLFRGLDLTGTLAPLVVVALAVTPLSILLFWLTFWRIPRSVFDAATVAGTGPLRLWWAVALPLARPTVFAVAVLAFAEHWAAFADALLYVGDERLLTVPVAVQRLATLEPSNHPLLLAAATLATVPPVVLFLAAHRLFLVRAVEGR